MKYLPHPLFWLLLLFTVLPPACPAADEIPPYTLLIQPEDQERLLLPLLQKALNRNRDNLKRAGITVSPARLGRQEKEILDKTLRAEGYYGSESTFSHAGQTLTYTVTPGTAYRLIGITISDAPGIEVPSAAELGLSQGMQLRAAPVLAAEQRLDQYVREHNCLWQPVSRHEITLKHGDAGGDVRFTVDAGEQARFGEVSISGLSSVRQAYVREQLDIRPEQCYQNRSVERGRLRLLQSGLFALVETRADPPREGVVDLHLTLKENFHRTITAGVGFSTDEGLSLTTGWQHRNIFGSAEQLKVEGKGSILYKSLESTLTIPAFRHARQVLIMEAGIFDENTDAYDAYGISMAAKLKRQLTAHLTATAGSRYQYKIITEKSGEDNFGLFSLPLALEHDSRDNILDSRNGLVAALTLEPFLDTLDTDVMFVKSSLGVSVYHTFADFSWSPTLAARGVLGTIFGISVADIPAHERFYSGGGGSVRGYGFQQLGPRSGDNPDGGRSLAEVSLEARLRFTDSWGGVVFMDGGNVYDDSVPRVGNGLQWAAGLGVRYTTALAPVRFDIAFPLERRNGIDDAFQIYISLAQAF